MASTTWTIQRKQRAKGWYYEGVSRNADGSRRCVTLGYVTDAPEPPALADRLRTAGGFHGVLSDDEIKAIASNPARAPVEIVLHARGVGTTPTAVSAYLTRTEPVSAVAEPVRMTPAILAAVGKPPSRPMRRARAGDPRPRRPRRRPRRRGRRRRPGQPRPGRPVMPRSRPCVRISRPWFGRLNTTMTIGRRKRAASPSPRSGNSCHRAM